MVRFQVLTAAIMTRQEEVLHGKKISELRNITDCVCDFSVILNVELQTPYDTEGDNRYSLQKNDENSCAID